MRDVHGAVGGGVALGAGEGACGDPGRTRAGSGRQPPCSALLEVLDRRAQLSSQDGKGDLGDPPPTRPTVGVPIPRVRWKRYLFRVAVWFGLISRNWNPAGRCLR